jgi:putative pyruvate formate lyase activating enzyme
MNGFDLFAEKASGRVPAAFVVARSIGFPADDPARLDDVALGSLHREGMARHRRGESSPGRVTLLDVKLELARRLLAPCRLCALDCRVDRRSGPAGACGLGPGLARTMDFVHEGEEPEISPTHAVLLSGCNYRCAYCSEWDHVAYPERDPVTPTEAIARSIEARRAAGVASLSWIGGDPGVNLPGILEVLTRTRVSVPVVWNSNMHSTEPVRDLLEGVVDAYVADLKHGSDACALTVARAPAHLETVVAAIERARREAFTIVRHLVLPGHVACCTLPVLETIARSFPSVRVNLMAQYRPNANVRGTPLDRRPTAGELRDAREAARRLGLRLEPAGSLRRAGKIEGADPGFASGIDFASGIHIDPDGSVTFENLSPDLAEIARELGEGEQG